jgi:hypothetical protein
MALFGLSIHGPIWLGSASVATTWGWNLAGIKEWFGLRVAASDVQHWECTIFLWMTKPIYSFRAQLPLWLGGSVDLHNCHFRCCRISCAVVMCTGWHCFYNTNQDSTSSRLLPGSSYSCCIRNLHALVHLPR